VLLDKPTVLDTARLQSGAITVTLFGIDGQSGEPAQGLQGFISAATAPITCQAQPDGSSVCLMPDGTDIAEAALINGAARAHPDAPKAYQDQQLAAQTARRGIWSSLPPPPEEVRHPSVPNTATLVAAGKTYRIDGIEGFAAPYAGQMQSYIAANGDVLSCNAQATPGTYTCLLRDGTDLAKIALVNGAARVSADAPDAYRLQQGDALANKRGFWSTPQGSALIATLTTAPPPAPDYPLLAGDDGGDGISYVGGQPTALIDGSVVFLTFVGLAGWGYYDAFHHWHDAPGRYREHLDRYHPNGEGLRGYDHGVRGPAMALNRPGNIGVNHPAGFGGRPEGPVGRPGGPVPQVSHAGPAAPMPGRPAPAAARPMGGAPQGGRPGGLIASPRPPAPSPGFVRPAPSAAGFHPSAPAPAPHPAPAAPAKKPVK
jgi:endonuclease YncB( thermonuclease family)